MGGQTLSFSSCRLLLLMLTVLVIELVGGFEWTAWNQTGRKAWLVGGEGGQHRDPWIQSDKEVLIHPGFFHLGLIDHLDHVMIRFGHETDLLDLLGVLLGFDEPPKLGDGDFPLR